ncbi:BsuPI-related putative proteinase inhibitor [Shouchella lonarensis]|uniref:Intracellular proteinase inhibitor n=1 Tax=Shouchella lonarensis TaxID=1464122 RepID=A0A1G6GK02_9BACI|nr:BsuPI-related putative proteinase inhibitor [Shouchella lonarensis]SDB82239.1 Intracellular proteinase inhibitor [Shouchella lonarensis]
MKFVHGCIAVLAVFLMVACNGQEKNDDVIPTGGAENMDNIWAFEVDVEQKDDMLHVEMSLENVSGKGQTLVFPTSQVYDITLSNAQGEMIYRHSDGYMYTQQIVEVHYKADEKKAFTETVPLKNIPAGTYTMSVYLTPSQQELKKLGDENVLTDTFEIEIKDMSSAS